MGHIGDRFLQVKRPNQQCQAVNHMVGQAACMLSCSGDVCS